MKDPDDKSILGALALAGVLFLGFPGVASAGVLVVGLPGSGAEFNSIHSAIAAAQNGDVILVRSGGYSSCTIDGKSLSIVADTAASVSVSKVTVKNLTASQTVVLTRLQANSGFEAIQNLGRIRVQGCHLVGANGLVPGTSGTAGAKISLCADVALSQCVFQGGSAYSDFAMYSNTARGGDAVRIDDFSTVAIHDSFATGGMGGGAAQAGGDGGFGIGHYGATLLLSNVHAEGGDGGNVIATTGPIIPGDGGNALYIGSGIVRTLGLNLVGGQHGSAFFDPNPAHADDVVANGAWISWPSPPKGFGIPKVLREGQGSIMQFAGVAGETAWLLASAQPGLKIVPTLKGHLLVNAGAMIGPLFVGVVPATGVLAAPFTLGELPAGTLALEIHLQGALAAPNGAVTLTGANQITWLDSTL